MAIFSTIYAILSFGITVLIALFFLAAGWTGRFPRLAHPRSFRSNRFLSLKPVRIVCILFGLMFLAPIAFMLIGLLSDRNKDDGTAIYINGHPVNINEQKPVKVPITPVE